MKNQYTLSKQSTGVSLQLENRVLITEEHMLRSVQCLTLGANQKEGESRKNL